MMRGVFRFAVGVLIVVFQHAHAHHWDSASFTLASASGVPLGRNRALAEQDGSEAPSARPSLVTSSEPTTGVDGDNNLSSIPSDVPSIAVPTFAPTQPLSSEPTQGQEVLLDASNVEPNNSSSNKDNELASRNTTDSATHQSMFPSSAPSEVVFDQATLVTVVSEAPTMSLTSGVPSSETSLSPSRLQPASDASAAPTLYPTEAMSDITQESAVPSSSPTEVDGDSPRPSSSPSSSLNADWSVVDGGSASPSYGDSSEPSMAPTAVSSAGFDDFGSSAPSSTPSNHPTPGISQNSGTNHPSAIPSSVTSFLGGHLTGQDFRTAVPSSSSQSPSAFPTTRRSATLDSSTPSFQPSLIPSFIPTTLLSFNPAHGSSASGLTLDGGSHDSTNVETGSMGPSSSPTSNVSSNNGAAQSLSPSCIPSSSPELVPSQLPSQDILRISSLSETPTTSPSPFSPNDVSISGLDVQSEIPSSVPSVEPSATGSASSATPDVHSSDPSASPIGAFKLDISGVQSSTPSGSPTTHWSDDSGTFDLSSMPSPTPTAFRANIVSSVAPSNPPTPDISQSVDGSNLLSAIPSSIPTFLHNHVNGTALGHIISLVPSRSPTIQSQSPTPTMVRTPGDYSETPTTSPTETVSGVESRIPSVSPSSEASGTAFDASQPSTLSGIPTLNPTENIRGIGSATAAPSLMPSEIEPPGSDSPTHKPTQSPIVNVGQLAPSKPVFEELFGITMPSSYPPPSVAPTAGSNLRPVMSPSPSRGPTSSPSLTPATSLKPIFELISDTITGGSHPSNIAQPQSPTLRPATPAKPIFETIFPPTKRPPARVPLPSPALLPAVQQKPFFEFILASSNQDSGSPSTAPTPSASVDPTLRPTSPTPGPSRAPLVPKPFFEKVWISHTADNPDTAQSRVPSKPIFSKLFEKIFGSKTDNSPPDPNVGHSIKNPSPPSPPIINSVFAAFSPVAAPTNRPTTVTSTLQPSVRKTPTQTSRPSLSDTTPTSRPSLSDTTSTVVSTSPISTFQSFFSNFFANFLPSTRSKVSEPPVDPSRAPSGA